MPIVFRIHRDLRLVWAEASGTIMAEDLFEYQRAAWTQPDVQGYDELVDMTAVVDIPAPSPAGMRALATLAATMDPPAGRSKFAIVAADDLVYGLGRMYQTHRGLIGNSGKEIAIFRTLRGALDWLGISKPLTPDSVGPA